MSISGNLKTMALPELFQWLAEGRKTGLLRLDSGLVEKQILFSEGRVIGTSSSDPKEYLGHFLVSHGYINETELANAVAMQEDNKILLGQILTSIGVLKQEELERMLYLKSEETLYELFTWPEGEFQFTDGEEPDGSLHAIDLDITRVLLRGTQRLDEWIRIREMIPSPNAVVVSVAGVLTDDPAMTPILEAINDDRTVTEIALHTHSSEFHVCRLLVELVDAESIKLVRPRGPVAAEEPQEVVETGTESLLAQAHQRLEREDFIGGLRHLRAARSLEPDAPGVVQAIAEAESRIRDELREHQISLKSVPSISDDVNDISTLQMSPDEGFLLSRVNGELDIGTILKISPMDPLEAQVAFLRLKSAGYIEIS